MSLRRFLQPLRAAVIFLCSAAHAAPGDLDALDANVLGSAVFATAVQPDGKVIIAGGFVSVLGVPRSNLARLNADGTLDMEFDPRPNDWVYSVAVQADGKVVFGGRFTTLQPGGTGPTTSRRCIARLQADGAIDTGFDPRADGEYPGVYSIALQADGKLLLGGGFTSLQPNGADEATTRQYIARVNADGTLDNDFDPQADSGVESIAVQEDGKVVLGGWFGSLQPNGAVTPTARWHIARVNADGTLDDGFDPKTNYIVFSVAVQADGKVLLGGAFATLQPNGAGAPIQRRRIARVHADGTLDMEFDPKANDSVHNVTVQADGKVLLGGYFTTLQTNGASTPTARKSIARVNADGTLDDSFDPGADRVASAAVQADGMVLLGGGFLTFQPNGAGVATPRKYFARLQNDPATQTLTAPDATQILWQRGGAGPEASRVTLELSTNGGASWTPLGPGTRTGSTADWQLTGLALPAGGRIRARGVTTGGYHGGSTGLIEQVTSFSFSTNADGDNDGLLDTWELTHWPTTTGHDPADDFDHDGYDELLELALGLNPTAPDPGGLPPVTKEGGYLTMTIAKQPGVTYEVQSAGTVLPALPDSFSAASTTVLVNDATTLKVRDNFLIGTPNSRFLRVKVTASP